MNAGQFESLRASTLYCRKCGHAMPVRERLLLVLPGRDIFDYACRGCGQSLGSREVTQPAGQPAGNTGTPKLFIP